MYFSWFRFRIFSGEGSGLMTEVDGVGWEALERWFRRGCLRPAGTRLHRCEIVRKAQGQSKYGCQLSSPRHSTA
jgi:hypothetical protein